MWVISGFESSVATGRDLQFQRDGETPMYWYMDCSSQMPNLGQPVQSAGCVARMSSMAMRRALSALAPSTFTTMPSRTVVRQAWTGSTLPSTSTMQRPQVPAGRRSGCLQRCGTKMPAPSAASRTDWPFWASTSCPFMVSFKVFLSKSVVPRTPPRPWQTSPPHGRGRRSGHDRSRAGASPTRRHRRSPRTSRRRSRRRCDRSSDRSPWCCRGWRSCRSRRRWCRRPCPRSRGRR